MKLIKNAFVFSCLLILDILYLYIGLTLLKYIGINLNNVTTTTKSIIYILIELSFMLILYLIYRKDINKEFKKYIHNFKKDFSFGLKCWLIGLIIMIISNIVINQIYGTTASNEVSVQNQLAKSPIYIVFSACIIAPFCEEIIFRKSLRNIFNSDILFIIVSGLVFGFIHCATGIGTSQMLYIIPYGIFGIMFGYIYVKTNTIFTSITFHMIHNIIITTISLISLGVI